MKYATLQMNNSIYYTIVSPQNILQRFKKIVSIVMILQTFLPQLIKYKMKFNFIHISRRMYVKNPQILIGNNFLAWIVTI